MEDTISAIATAAGTGGIGIVRISGENAVAVADKIFRGANGRKICDTKSHRVLYGKIVDERENVIDEAVALIMRAPSSYTREDVVELQCHGGIMPLRKTLALTFAAGARAAERGEFTKRAFLNGRIDLAEAQAVMDVVGAKTERALSAATGNLTGKLSQKIGELRGDILAMIAHLEAAIDFPEDDIDELFSEQIRKKVVDLINEIDKTAATFGAGKILREGITAAIVGVPNVGKSSLLNALLREERAIVTDIPGTTRDSIEEYIDIGGIPLRIIDTAGIRDATDEVEKIGVSRAKTCADSADLILAVFDASKELSAQDKEIISLVADRNAIIILNKSDLPPKISADDIKRFTQNISIINISAKNSDDIKIIEDVILKKADMNYFNEKESVIVANERQANLLSSAKEHLEAALATVDSQIGEDFVVIDLKAAWEKLGEITGETVGNDIVDAIFSNFCIGK